MSCTILLCKLFQAAEVSKFGKRARKAGLAPSCKKRGQKPVVKTWRSDSMVTRQPQFAVPAE